MKNYTLETFASVLEEGLVPDLHQTIEKNPLLFEGASIALMEDTHIGNGVPVGFTARIPKNEHYDDFLISPSFISADIGCGMTSNIYAHGIKLDKNVLIKLRDFINERVPLGGRGYSLGGGNHFIEVGVSECGLTAVTVHSGSRGFGGRVFKKFNTDADWKQITKQEREVFIQQMKAEGRERELSEMLAKQVFNTKNERAILRFEKSGYAQEMRKAVRYAQANRKYLLSIIDEFMTFYANFCLVEQYDTIHNYAHVAEDELFIRKGAIAANPGSVVIIPINMKDGIIIGTLAEKSFAFRNWSLPHGAGRLHSRTSAKENLSLKEFEESMRDIVTNDLTELLDEAPLAYKKIDDILAGIEGEFSHHIIFKPVLNIKGE